MDIWLFFWVLAIVLFLQGRQLGKLKKSQARNRELEQRLTVAETKIETLLAREIARGGPLAFELDPFDDPSTTTPPSEPVRPLPLRVPKPAEPPPKPLPAPEPAGEKTTSRSTIEKQKWQRLERHLLENWTGILGAVILVAGVTFLGIYSALMVPPLVRTLMIGALAPLLVGIGRWLMRRAEWRQVGLWSHSMAAALFLLACFGAGAIPGLKWIDPPGAALAVLMLGVGVNLLLATRTGNQAQGSLHVLLSLVPLTILPDSPVSFTLATLVTLHGLFLAVRGHWERHLLATLIGYAGFHAFWQWNLPVELAAIQPLGRLGLLAVHIPAGLIHYRKNRASPHFELLPFAVHIGNWTLLGLSLALFHPSPMPIRSLALLGSAVAAFLLARRAKQLGIRWLFLTDTLVAQGLAVAALLFFLPVAANIILVLALLLLETLLFQRLVRQEEPLLAGTAHTLVQLATLALTIGGLVARWHPGGDPWAQNGLILLACALTATFTARHRSTTPSGPGYPAWLLGSLTGVGFLYFSWSPWFGPLALTVLATLVLLARGAKTAHPAQDILVASLIAHLLVWAPLLLRGDIPPGGQLLLWTPLALFMPWFIHGNRQWGLTLFQLSVTLTGLHLALGAFALTVTVSNLAPPVSWLCLSLLALEIGHRLPVPQRGAVFGLGFFYLALFFPAHAVFILPIEHYLGSLKVRLWIELFALAVLFTWWHASRTVVDAGTEKTPGRGHAWFLELTGLFLIGVVLVEVSAPWRPLLWSGLAIALLFAPIDARHSARLRLHALWFFWGALINLVAVTAIFHTPSPLWYEQPDFTGSLALIFLVAFLVLAQSRLQLLKLPFPGGFDRLADLATHLHHHRLKHIHYPFFLGVALFLVWRFDAVILTLLLFLETTVLFVLSIFLREPHFRTVAMVAMAICLLRLVFYDLTNAGTLTRGVVFLGVGGMMLAINMLFNRYKDRLS